jgi:hypothetical protein
MLRVPSGSSPVQCRVAGKVEEVRRALLPVVQACFASPAVFKAILRPGRIPTPDVRLPLLGASGADPREAIRNEG